MYEIIHKKKVYQVPEPLTKLFILDNLFCKKYINGRFTKKLKIDPNYPWCKTVNEYVYCILNDIHTQPLCKECKSKYVSFQVFSHGYSTFCGPRCGTLNKDTRAKSKATCQRLYGVDYTFQSNQMTEKSIKTLQSKYGKDVTNIMHVQSIKEKLFKTNIDRYGTKCTLQSKQSIEKSKKTCQERYGNDIFMGSKAFIEKSKLTYQMKYGCDFFPESKQFKDLFKDPIWVENLQNKVNESKRKNDSYSSISKGEIELGDYIESLGYIIKRNDRTLICPLEIDIFIPKHNIGFEYNGDYWHMNPLIYESTNFNKSIHKTAKQIWDKDADKIELCRLQNVRLIHIWEFDWSNNNKLIKDYIKSILEG